MLLVEVSVAPPGNAARGSFHLEILQQRRPRVRLRDR
jgi:hypothetical protein